MKNERVFRVKVRDWATEEILHTYWVRHEDISKFIDTQKQLYAPQKIEIVITCNDN